MRSTHQNRLCKSHASKRGCGARVCPRQYPPVYSSRFHTYENTTLIVLTSKCISIFAGLQLSIYMFARQSQNIVSIFMYLSTQQAIFQLCHQYFMKSRLGFAELYYATGTFMQNLHRSIQRNTMDHLTVENERQKIKEQKRKRRLIQNEINAHIACAQTEYICKCHGRS